MADDGTSVTCEEVGPVVRLASDRLALDFDRTTGRWLSLDDRGDGARILDAGDLLSPLLLTVGGRATATRHINQLFAIADAETVGLHWRLEGYEFQPDGAGGRFTTRLREGDWRAEISYGLSPGRSRVERRVRLEYVGAGEALLRGFTLRTPYATLGPAHETFLEAPGYAVRPGCRVSALWHGPWGALSEGTFCDAPAWRPPFVGLHHPATPRTLGIWAWTQTEPFFPHADRADEGVLFSHHVYLADRFTQGHVLEWGTQFLEVYPDLWLAALAKMQNFYGEVGFTVAPDVPEWARSVEMYEVHVGTLTGTKLAPFPTYAPLIADLPSIKDKGFDVVYIMPHVPYPSYAVIDYMDMDIHQGSASDFRAFVDRAHEVGLKVFMDVTLHGAMDRRARRELEHRSSDAYPMEPTMPEVHPYLTEHPDWFSRTESGDVAMTYTYAFDHASPSWQEFMARVFRFYVEDFDVDGFRVDSHTWNFFPNWARGLPRPASHSFYGSATLLDRVRRELQTIKPDIVLYTETAGPLLYQSHALAYNYDETWMLVSALPLLTRSGLLCHFLTSGHVATERMTARDIAQWLTQSRLALPPGAVKVRGLDNHDTYWVGKEFRRQTFGRPAARAIVAFFAFLDGGFMDYHGADEGSEAFYRKVLRLRRTLPILKQGTCDYLAVKPTKPMVFAPLWRQDGHFLLPVIHFDNCPATVGLPLPLEDLSPTAERFQIFDWMSEEYLPGPNGLVWDRRDLPSLRVEMDAYGVRLLDFQPAGPDRPRLKRKGEW